MPPPITPSPESTPSPEATKTLVEGIRDIFGSAKGVFGTIGAVLGAAGVGTWLQYLTGRKAAAQKAQEIELAQRKSLEDYTAKLQQDIRASYQEHLDLLKGHVVELGSQLQEGKEQIALRDMQIERQAGQIEAQDKQLHEMQHLQGMLITLLIKKQILPKDWKPADGFPADDSGVAG